MNARQSILAAAALLTAAFSASSHAATFNEVGDAGQTASTAQDAVGFNRIIGALGDFGGGDIDFYRIFIEDPASFGVTVDATLSIDNDTELFLFDQAFDLVLENDDLSDSGTVADVSNLSIFRPGELAGAAAGIYFLAISIFDAEGQDGGTITVDPDPFQTGPYTLDLTGVSTVPLPATLPLGAAAFATLAFVGRRRRARA